MGEILIFFPLFFSLSLPYSLLVPHNGTVRGISETAGPASLLALGDRLLALFLLVTPEKGSEK